jgi:hypothetical protein
VADDDPDDPDDPDDDTEGLKTRGTDCARATPKPPLETGLVD